MHKVIWFLLIIIFLIFSKACSSKKQNENRSVPTKSDTISTAADTLSKEKTIKVSYYYFYINNNNDLDSFNNKFTSSQRRIISDLNRIDENRIKPVDSIVIPDIIVDSLIFYTPFPWKLNKAKEIKKLILISRRIQALSAYENGVLVRWAPTSTGKRSTPTPAGLFFTNWKAESTISTVNTEWLMNWYFNIDNFRGISIHEYAMPGYPASHACIRLKKEDAQWLYNWGQQWVLTSDQQSIIAYGIPVIIYEDYNFDENPPWNYLVENPDTTNQSEDFLNTVLKPHYELILKRQTERDSLEINVF